MKQTNFHYPRQAKLFWAAKKSVKKLVSHMPVALAGVQKDFRSQNPPPGRKTTGSELWKAMLHLRFSRDKLKMLDSTLRSV